MGRQNWSESLWPHEPQHARLPCPSTPRACLNSCPLRRWCHPTISSSVVPFSSCLQSFPASRSFLMSQLFTSGGQSTGAPASALVLPINIQDWSFRMDWFDLLTVQGTLKSLLQYHSSKALIFQHSAFFMVQLSHPYMTTGKTIALTIQIFVGKVMSLVLLYNKGYLSQFPMDRILKQHAFSTWVSVSLWKAGHQNHILWSLIFWNLQNKTEPDATFQDNHKSNPNTVNSERS